MDSFTLDKLEFDQVRRILSRYCRCALGSALAGRIGPSRRPETVRQWLEETTQMAQAIREEGPPPLGGVTDVHEALRRACPGGGAGGEDFAAIAATLEGAGSVRQWGPRLGEAVARIKELAACLPDFSVEVGQIRSVVDARGEVMDAASEALARIRRSRDATRQRIHEVIYGYVRRPEVARILQNPAVTLHDDRFVLPVKAEHRHQLPGVVHRSSQTGATLFVEPSESVELNNQLVELLDHQRREEARLLEELAIRVHHRHDQIAAALGVLGQIDLLAAKAQYAAEFDFSAPEMTERGGVQLHQLRHPLLVEQAYQQETGGPPGQAVHQVVPINVRLGVDFDVLIITGSNTGGKTVALKTVGLVAIMAQAGLLVPVQRGSTLPVFRDVLLDVGDEQSLQQSLSTFGAHVRRINHVLRRADRFSLVLLDELGAGTDPDEGAAIGQAVLDELQRVGCLTMVTTHLSALKAYAINHPRVDNASVEFDTRTLRPTYHLRIGEPGESHAITVAAAMGLPKGLIGSARKYLHQRVGAFSQAIRATSASRRVAEEARSQAHAARLAAQDAQQQYTAKFTQVQQLQRDFEAWLASLAEYRPGDQVPVPGMNKTGRLVRLQFNKQIAVVDVDNLQVEVPLAELMPDLGQSPVRQELTSLREQVLLQARQADELRREAQRLQEEYRRSLSQQRARQQQYEQWLAAIGEAKVHQQVPIARPPGTAKLVELDFLSGQAKVEIPEGTVTLPLQDLFPQAGPFAVRRRPEGPSPRPGRPGIPARRSGMPPPRSGMPARRPPPSGAPQKDGPPSAAPQKYQGMAARRPPPLGAPEKDQPPRPLVRRRPDGAAARANRQAVLATPPGEQVYVVPFHKRATLIRFNEDKDQATVQSGAFEMQLPVADLEPVRDRKAAAEGAERAEKAEKTKKTAMAEKEKNTRAAAVEAPGQNAQPAGQRAEPPPPSMPAPTEPALDPPQPPPDPPNREGRDPFLSR